MCGEAPGRRQIWLTYFVIPLVVTLVGRPLPGQTAGQPKPITPQSARSSKPRLRSCFKQANRPIGKATS